MQNTATEHQTIEAIEADPRWRFFYQDFTDNDELSEVCVYLDEDDNAARFTREIEEDAGEDGRWEDGDQVWSDWVREPGPVRLDSAECLMLYQSSLPEEEMP